MKPTLGHASRIAAIRALRSEGKTEMQIASAIGIRPNTVTSLESRARQRGSLGHGSTHKLRLSGEMMRELQEAAEARGVTPSVLANSIIRTVARDDLFAAVLDEG